MTVKLSLKDLTKRKIEQQTSKEILTSSLSDDKIIKDDSQNPIPKDNKTKIVLNLNKKINIDTKNETPKDLNETKIKDDNTIEIKNNNLIGGIDYEEITSKIEIKKSGGTNNSNGEIFSNYQSELVLLADKKQDKKEKIIIKKPKKVYLISSFTVLLIFAIFSILYFIEDIETIIGIEKNLINKTNLTQENNINNELEQDYNSPLDETEIINGTGNIIEINNDDIIIINNDNIPIIDDNIINNKPIQDPEIKKKTEEKIMEIYLKKTMIR